MATLRNKRKLAAVSRKTPEGTRSSIAQNVLDPELTQDYISQVSEEIEGRVTKKLSKEFSKTESRILGALSKLVSSEPTSSDLFRRRSGCISLLVLWKQPPLIYCQSISCSFYFFYSCLYFAQTCLDHIRSPTSQS